MRLSRTERNRPLLHTEVRCVRAGGCTRQPFRGTLTNPSSALALPSHPLPPRQGEAGTRLGINEITWIQATCGKPLSTTQVRDSFPQKCQGQGLQGMTLWDLPPLSLLREVRRVDIFQQTFQIEASSRRKESGAPYSSCPDCADTFCIH